MYPLPFGISPSINFAILEVLRIMHYDFFSYCFLHMVFFLVCVIVASHVTVFLISTVSLQCCFSFNNSVSKIIQLYIDTDIKYSSMCYTVGPWFGGLVSR